MPYSAASTDKQLGRIMSNGEWQIFKVERTLSLHRQTERASWLLFFSFLAEVLLQRPFCLLCENAHYFILWELSNSSGEQNVVSDEKM